MVIIEMTDAKTLDPLKGETCDSMVASGGTSRRTGFKGSGGASTVNPDCTIKKEEKYRKRLMDTVVMKGKLARARGKNSVPHGN